jgi:hypothetical protein
MYRVRITANVTGRCIGQIYVRMFFKKLIEIPFPITGSLRMKDGDEKYTLTKVEWDVQNQIFTATRQDDLPRYDYIEADKFIAIKTKDYDKFGWELVRKLKNRY